MYNPSGNVGINTNTPSCKLDVVGALNVKGTYSTGVDYNKGNSCLTMGSIYTYYGGQYQWVLIWVY